MSRVRTWSLLAVAAAAIGLAACGSSSSGSTTTTTAAPSSTTTSAPTTTTTGAAATGSTTTTAAAAATAGAVPGIAVIPTADRSPVGTAGHAPTIVVPKSTAPTELQAADLITGTGATAKAGDQITVQYVLATYSSGGEVQSSWDSQPFTFVLGEGNVIPGWDKGVVGMQVGGRRELIIPPSLGYGAQSPGSGIAANDTLVFIVDLVKVN
jgi:peptidylprolyl isomerase